MDSKNCKMLLTALELGSLTAAAEKLGYTTSGVGRAIETLEKQAGFPILQRSHRGVRLTREGRRLLPTIRKFVNLDDSYNQLAAELAGVQIGAVTVGTAYTLYYPWLCSVMKDFHAQYPQVSLRIIEGTSSELAQMIENRELDFGMTAKRKGSNQWVPLVEDELVAILPRDHHLAGFSRISAGTFAIEPFIELHPGRESDNSLFFAEHNITPNTVFSTNDSLALFSMVGAGMGISMVNGLLAKRIPGNVIGIPLEPPCRIDCGAMTQDDESISPAARCFYDFAMERKDSLPR